MIGAWIFGVVSVAQGVFVLLLIGFIAVRRNYDRQRRAAFRTARLELDAPLREWLVVGSSPDPVVRALRELPRGTALGYVSLLARQTIPTEQREELAAALRDERWIVAALRHAASRFWWRRLEAARALALVGAAHDRPTLARLLADAHPAVQVAAAAAIPRVADRAMLGLVLDAIVYYPKVVRQYLTGILRQTRGLAGPALAERIREGEDDVELSGWVELAGALDEPEAMAAALTRADHPEAKVRRAVARTLARFPSPAAEEALDGLAADRAPTVRAAAARALGDLGASRAAPVLAPMLRDPVWTVRLRSALALAQLGERGRAALATACESDDRFARDMATYVSGLSDGAVLELADA